MSRSTVRPPRVLAALTLVATTAATFALAACSAGQVTQTAVKTSSIQGVNATVGDIAIRNAAVAFPVNGAWKKGDTADLTMRLVNTGNTPDKLIKVHSAIATFVQLEAAPAASGSPSASVAPSVTPSASASASAGPSASASASPTTSGVPAPSSTSPEQVKIDLELLPATVVALDESGSNRLRLQKLTQDIEPGQIVEVTLTFERAGEITLKLPVMTPLSPQPRGTPVKGVEERAAEGAAKE